MKLMRSAHAKHIDYGFLHGIDPNSPNFVPSDIDGVIERNGVFLFLEWKHFLEDMSEGQKKMLVALSKKPDVFVVKVIGDTDDVAPNIYEFSIMKDGEWVTKGKSLQEFVNFYIRWLEYATKQKTKKEL
jgi:hypothetical protein